MTMHTEKAWVLLPETCEHIRKTTGLAVEQISEMHPEDLDAYLARRMHGKLMVTQPGDARLAGSGSILLGRLSYTHDIERRLECI